MTIKRLSHLIRIMAAVFITLVGVLTIISSAPTTTQYNPSSTPSSYTFYKAEYQFSLSKVERPKAASKRYGAQKVDVISTDQKYKFAFEDNMVRVLWFVSNSQIGFLVQNKTDYSIKIPWDEAAYVDESGRSHRVMHSGIKYTDRDNPQPPSVIVRKGTLEDIVYPTDYVSWSSGTKYTAGDWKEKPLLLSSDFHGTVTRGHFSTLPEFENAVNANIGKQLQVLLPLQIQDVVNDYIFTFNIDKATASSSTN